MIVTREIERVVDKKGNLIDINYIYNIYLTSDTRIRIRAEDYHEICREIKYWKASKKTIKEENEKKDLDIMRQYDISNINITTKVKD